MKFVFSSNRFGDEVEDKMGGISGASLISGLVDSAFVSGEVKC